jgi:DNA-binding transcriptional MerR regulator
VHVPPEPPPRAADRLDDDDYPAYTMGRAAEMIGATPSFLRAIGEARLITPLRSEGGHRRYSRYQLRIAARARELVDSGTPVEAACRIVILEDQLEEARRLNEEMRGRLPAGDDSADPDAAEIIGTPAEGLWSGGLSEIRSRARPVAPCYGGTSCSRGSQSFDSGAFLRTG